MVSRLPLPFLPSGTITNLPGRVQIFADNLNLDRARIRAEGHLLIDTVNLVASTNTIIDAENLSFHLNSTNGTLNMQGLAQDGVVRLRGSIQAWSAIWQADALVVLDSFDTNGLPSPVTNVIHVAYHTLMLDATGLQTSFPVTVFDFKSDTANVILNDNMSVVQSLFFGGVNLTLNGNLNLTSTIIPNTFGLGVLVSVPDWTASIAPNLLNLTNNGRFTILNEGHFGDDRATPYASFVNNAPGTITAASIAVNALYFANSGSMLAVNGPMTVQSVSGKLENGTNGAAGDMAFIGGTLQVSNHVLITGGELDFNLTGALFDSGPGGTTNLFDVRNGFNLLVKPATGDLLGTTVRSTAPTIARVFHTWAGEDRGATAAGYLNNVALGELELVSLTSDPLFVFSGAGAQNGLYVDVLDLGALDTNFLNEIVINPNLTIYFAAVLLPPGTVLPPATSAEEFMNGKFGGHLVWDQNFAGAASAMPVVINGQSYLVNAALAKSQLIDSDGDSTKNFFDATPFSTPPVAGAGFAAQTFVDIQSPESGDSFEQPAVSVHGVAGDRSGLARVYYRLNDGGWLPAASADGASWNGTVKPQPGANVIQAFAVGSAGDVSTMSTVNFLFTPTATLVVNLNGSGTVSPNYNGALLLVNESYNVTAQPAAGYAFSNWVAGGVVSTSPQLTFVMQSNLVITANFVPQAFSPEAGSYNGLFSETNGARLGKSGAFSATTTARGTYSGNLQIGASRYPFSGEFNASGTTTNNVRRKNASSLTLVLQAGGGRITGTVGDGTWNATVEAYRAAFQAKGNLAPFAGRYTMVIPGADDSDEDPEGSGFGTLTVDASGKVQLNGELADGQKFTRATGVSVDGKWPLYTSLYGGNGQVLGWLAFSNTPQSDLSGWMRWIKPSTPRAKFPRGFNILCPDITGDAYNQAASPLLSFDTVAFLSDDLGLAFSNNVSFGPGNHINNLSGNKLTLTLTPSKGSFKGNTVDPVSGDIFNFSGVILQKQNTGAGYFLDSNESGKVTLQP